MAQASTIINRYDGWDDLPLFIHVHPGTHFACSVIHARDGHLFDFVEITSIDTLLFCVPVHLILAIADDKPFSMEAYKSACSSLLYTIFDVCETCLAMTSSTIVMGVLAIVSLKRIHGQL